METLAAVLLLSLISTAIFSAVLMVISADEQQKSGSRAAVAARNYADALSSGNYVDCAPAGSYDPSQLSVSLPGASVAVTSITYWNGQPLPSVSNPTAADWATAFGTTCSTDRATRPPAPP